MVLERWRDAGYSCGFLVASRQFLSCYKCSCDHWEVACTASWNSPKWCQMIPQSERTSGQIVITKSTQLCIHWEVVLSRFRKSKLSICGIRIKGKVIIDEKTPTMQKRTTSNRRLIISKSRRFGYSTTKSYKQIWNSQVNKMVQTEIDL